MGGGWRKRPSPPILWHMGFFRDVSPRRGVVDLFRYVRQDRPHRTLFLLAASVPFLFILAGFALDAQRLSKPPPPTVTYVESWSLDRTDEEIMADQAVRQGIKDRALAKRQEAYRVLGHSLGMDMEKVEADAKAIREKSEQDALKQPGT